MKLPAELFAFPFHSFEAENGSANSNICEK